MKKALYILPYPKFFSQHAGVGGHVAHAAGVLQGLVESGYEVTVIAEEKHAIFDVDGITLKLIPCNSSSVLLRQLWALKLLKNIKNILKTEKFEFCYIRYSASFAPWMPRLKLFLGDTKLILEVNSLGSQWRSAFEFVDRRALKSVDRIICISKTLENHILTLFRCAKTPVDIRVVINGVNPERFDVTGVSLDPRSSVHVGFAGLLKENYGIETLIKAADILKNENVLVHIFGDGPYSHELKCSCKEIANVIFHGPIPFTEMPAYINALDILVYTTGHKYLYQSPTKLFEYMASGKAIVSAKTPQTLELLNDKKTAILFEVENANELADSLKKLLEDENIRNTIGKAAQSVVNREHTWKQRVASILADTEH